MALTLKEQYYIQFVQGDLAFVRELNGGSAL